MKRRLLNAMTVAVFGLTTGSSFASKNQSVDLYVKNNSPQLVNAITEHEDCLNAINKNNSSDIYTFSNTNHTVTANPGIKLKIVSGCQSNTDNNASVYIANLIRGNQKIQMIIKSIDNKVLIGFIDQDKNKKLFVQENYQPILIDFSNSLNFDVNVIKVLNENTKKELKEQKN